jgi:cellulose synthase (UDP-forming)
VAEAQACSLRLPTHHLLALLGLPLIAWYFSWLFDPERIGQPVLYGLLIAAELFNVIQAVGFWWTCAPPRRATSTMRLA